MFYSVISRVVQYKCPLCSFVSELRFLCKDHLLSDHENWKEEFAALRDFSATEKNASPHTNPDWLPNLTADFSTVVVSQCSARSRQAVEANEEITVREPLKKQVLV